MHGKLKIPLSNLLSEFRSISCGLGKSWSIFINRPYILISIKGQSSGPSMPSYLFIEINPLGLNW